jgi:hypothetical protein
MISLLITLLVVILVFGVIWYALSLIPLPPPFYQIAQLILLVVLLLVLLAYLLPLIGHPGLATLR